jgi:electron transport complex protein RnfG
MATAERSKIVALMFMTLVAGVAGGLITISHELSRERIAANQRERQLARLHEVLGSVEFDNAIETSRRAIDTDERLGPGGPIEVFVAMRGAEPVAVVFSVVAPRGYNGPIELLVGVAVDGHITAVRVTTHRETPGLGDAIEIGKSPWITGFTGTRLGQPPLADWRVSKDGGYFDAITGATVTPRAITEAVKNTLMYFRDHGAMLLALATEDRTGTDE